MQDMWTLSLPWWDFVLRAIITYAFLLVILRLTGKRQIGQMEPFDLVLLLVLSNALQNAMNGGDNTVASGMILALTLLGCNSLIAFITYRSHRAEVLIEGQAEVLIFDGKLMHDVAKRERLSHDELMAALRMGGCEKIEDVHLATMETNGQISVIRREEPEGGAPKIQRAQLRKRSVNPSQS